MNTPNKIIIKGEEITDEKLFLDYKETYLLLQKALLKAGLKNEMLKVGEIYDQSKTKILTKTQAG